MTPSQRYRSVVSVHGRPAQGRIHGVLRGGYVHEAVFYAPGATNVGVLSAPVEQVTELRHHDEVRQGETQRELYEEAA